MVKTISVMIVEDHLLLRESLRKTLKRTRYLNVVAEASDGEEAVEKAEKVKPDVVLMDISLPGLNGIEATKKIKLLNPATIVLILTAFNYDQYVFQALEAGASGYLLKDLSSQELVKSIFSVCRGESVFHPVVAAKLLSKLRSNKNGLNGKSASLLSDREVSILKLAAKGLNNHQIATQLQLSIRTIESHLRMTFNKLGADSRTQAVIKAANKGYFTLEELN